MGKLVTSHIYPPIPDRSHDWCAYVEGDEEASKYGYGATEEEAGCGGLSPLGNVSLGIAISAQNNRLAMSNADLRGVEPEMKSTIVGFREDGSPIWRRVPVTRIRVNRGWVETPLTHQEESHERASAR